MVLPRYLKECTFARWLPLTDNGFLTAEFWSAMTSDVLQFIVRPNEDVWAAVFTFNPYLLISLNEIIDINNSFIDINKYGHSIHLY